MLLGLTAEGQAMQTRIEQAIAAMLEQLMKEDIEPGLVCRELAVAVGGMIAYAPNDMRQQILANVMMLIHASYENQIVENENAAN